MKRAIRSILVVCSFAVLPSFAAAQERANEALQPGRRMIAVTLPWGGGSSAGVWFQRSETGAIGIEVTGAIEEREFGPDDDGERRVINLVVSPTLKRFMSRDHGSIAPFTRMGITGGYVRQETTHPDLGDDTEDGWLAGVHAGLGAEWFPWDRISVGSWVGLSASYQSVEENRWSVRTVAPRVTGQIYF